MRAREKLPALSECAMNLDFVSFRSAGSDSYFLPTCNVHPFPITVCTEGLCPLRRNRGACKLRSEERCGWEEDNRRMTKNDFNSDPHDQADPLSATGMFVNSFGSTPT